MVEDRTYEEHLNELNELCERYKIVSLISLLSVIVSGILLIFYMNLATFLLLVVTLFIARTAMRRFEDRIDILHESLKNDPRSTFLFDGEKKDDLH